MKRLAVFACSGIVAVCVSAGCGDGDETRPIEQAQQAREEVEQNLSDAGESLEKVDKSLKNVQEQLLEQQEQNTKLKEQLAEERRARRQAEAALAEAQERLGAVNRDQPAPAESQTETRVSPE